MHGAVTQYSPGPASDRRARPARAGPASASDGHRDLSVSESRSVGGLALIIRPTRMAVAVTVTVAPVGPGRGRPGPAGPGGRGPAASLRVYTRVRLGNRVPGGLGRRHGRQGPAAASAPAPPHPAKPLAATQRHRDYGPSLSGGRR